MPGSREKIRAEKEKRKSQRSNKRKSQKGGKRIGKEGRCWEGEGGRPRASCVSLKWKKVMKQRCQQLLEKRKKARNKISKRFQKGYSSVDPSDFGHLRTTRE